MIMAKGIFITAVGTDIGKTTVSCILIKLLKKRGIDCGVMKPVQCAGNDAEILMRASCVKDGKVLVNPFFLKHSYAPLLAF